MKKTMVIIAVCFVWISVLGNMFSLWYYGKLELGNRDSMKPYVVEQQDFTYLSRRIFTEHKNDIFINFVPLRIALRDYVSAQQVRISMYFEYLPSGSTIGINDSDEYAMASLVKVPTVMAVYKKIAEGELHKDQMLTVKTEDINQNFGTFWQQGVGAQITLQEAIEKTLIDSDNTTHNMLYNLLSIEDRRDIYSDLDIFFSANGPFVSAKSYSSILKNLYLSLYLSNADSNEILTYLSRSSYNTYLRAGVDSTVPFAHKMGVLNTVNGERISSDCGIVYLPQRPYVLCVLIFSEEAAPVETHMKYISRIIYEYISKINTVLPTDRP